MHIRLADCSSTPWKNQGGVTRELLAWPDATQWAVRLSLADIDQSGAFSQFNGVTRWFTLISGDGLRLDVGHQTYRLDADSTPVCFDGGLPCAATLEKGPLSAFNIMLSANWHAQVKRVRPDEPAFQAGKGWLALFSVQTGSYLLGRDCVHREAGELDWVEVSADVTVQALSGHWVMAWFWSSVSPDQP